MQDINLIMIQDFKYYLCTWMHKDPNNSICTGVLILTIYWALEKKDRFQHTDIQQFDKGQRRDAKVKILQIIMIEEQVVV
jgi:hypothetical protein